jgi:hypothetical protein
MLAFGVLFVTEPRFRIPLDTKKISKIGLENSEYGKTNTQPRWCILHHLLQVVAFANLDGYSARK